MRSPAQRAIAQPARQAVALPRARFTSTRTAASAADRVQLGDSDLNVSGARGWRLSTSAAAAARADGHPWVITTPARPCHEWLCSFWHITMHAATATVTPQTSL